MTTTDTPRVAYQTAAFPVNHNRASSAVAHSDTSSSAADQSQADAMAASRKLALLKRAGLFGSDLKGAQIMRATSLDDLRKAYALVHQVYLKSGYIQSDDSGMRLRMFETSSDTATFIAKFEGEVVGVISVAGDSADLGLPSDSAFRAELDTVRATGMRLCEVTNQVVADEFRKSAVTTELMRCAVAHSIKAGYRGGVATVSPSHNGFYDLLGFTQVGEERSYTQKLHDPVVALMIDFDNYRAVPEGLTPAAIFVHNFLGPENPYLHRVMMWDRKARAQFLNAELLEELFVIRSNFLAQCSPAELEIVRLRWGQELFRAVASSLPGYQEQMMGSAAPFADFAVESRLPVQSDVPFPAFNRQGADRGSHRLRVQLARGYLQAVVGAGQRDPKRATLWSWIRTILDPQDERKLALGN